MVALTRGIEGYAMDQFALTHNRPDLILERMGWGTEETKTTLREAWERRLRRAGFEPRDSFDTPDMPNSRIVSVQSEDGTATLTAEFAADKLPLTRYQIFVNDVPLFGPAGKQIQGNSATITDNFELLPGRNKIEVSCTNTSATESLRAVTYVENSASYRSTLYFVGIGVSDYEDDQLDLAYAAQDAIDLSRLFTNMEGRTPTTEKVITRTLLNADVTPAALKEAADTLQNATARDTVVIFVAGHGLYSREAAPTYYFLPHTADLSNIPGTGISFESIESLLINTPARRRLLLLDTCESGEIDPETDAIISQQANRVGVQARAVRGLSVVKSDNGQIKSPGEATTSLSARTYLLDRDRFIFNDLLRRSGAIVFSASGATEYSYEDNRYKNGLQHPTVDRDNIYQKIMFPLIK